MDAQPIHPGGSDSSGGEGSSGIETWIEWYCAEPGNEFLCEVDKRFIDDTFNLFGLREMISEYKVCMDIILDRVDMDDVR